MDEQEMKEFEKELNYYLSVDSYFDRQVIFRVEKEKRFYDEDGNLVDGN